MTGNRRVIHFGPGPAALPGEVLQEASKAILDYNNTGLSILEIAHRGKLFAEILEESKALVKELCGLNEEYEILWLQGGGRQQFAMIPMNFLGAGKTAGYIDSGYWAHDAMEYAKLYGNVNVLSSSREDNYTHLPAWPAHIPEDLAYLHFTTNNTIYGTQWPIVPQSSVPLIADMSSDIFSRKMAYANCALFYAVAQKNIGPAGVTLVAVNKYLLQQINNSLSPVLDYMAQVKANSLLNTAPIFSIYTSLLTLRWTKQKGIDAIEKENDAKAALLYEEIDRNPLFSGIVKKEDRSKMNVCFAADKQVEQQFIEFCRQRNITGIEGHRSVGSLRVSLYNAIPLSSVQVLVDAMKEFEYNYTNKK